MAQTIFKPMLKDEDSYVDQLLKLSQWYSGQIENKKVGLQNERVFLSDQLNQATSIDSLNNLKSTVEDYNNRVSSRGYDEYAINYGDKSYIYNQANNAYEDAKSIVDKNLGNPDTLYDEIMGYSWKETADEMQKLYNLKGNMELGKSNNFVYKANDKYTSTGLIAAVNTRMGQLQNKIKIFEENEGAFLVYDSNGVMDEESRAIYDDLQFRVLSGNTQEFDAKYDAMITSTSKKYQGKEGDYLKWKMIQDITKNKLVTMKDIDISALAAGAKTTTEDMWTWLNGEMAKANLTSEDYLDPIMVQNMIDDSQTAAEKYNKQHQILTGDYFADKYPWGTIETDENNIPGLNLNDPASKTGKGVMYDEAAQESYEVADEDRDISGMPGELGKETVTGPEGPPIEYQVSEENFETDNNWLNNAEKEIAEINKIDADKEEPSTNLPAKIVGTAATAYIFEDKLRQVGTYTKNQVVKAAKYVRAVTGISGANIDRFMNDKGVNVALKEIATEKDVLDGLKGAIKTHEKELKNLSKGTKEYNAKLKELNKVRKSHIDSKARLNKINKTYTNKFARKFKTKAANIQRLFNTKSRWSLFNLKADVTTRFPRVAGKIFGKVGSVAGPFATGSMIAEALGADTWGEKITGGVITTAAAKKFFPQLKKMITSPAGKKFLINKLGKKAATKIGTATLAGGGWFSLITGLAGTGLAVYDIYNAVKNFKE